MTVHIRAVAVRQLPEALNVKSRRLLLGELEGFMKIDRPRVVLDCSRLRQMDRPAIHLLLCCLEDAMKRNGDVKLSGIPAGAMAMLELTGVTRLFEIFETNADAVNSFGRHSLLAASQADAQGSSPRTLEDAA